MDGLFNTIFDTLKSWLNPTAFSWSSIEGIIVLILMFLLIRGFFLHPFKYALRIIIILLLVHIGFVLGFTPLNDIIPFRTIFKYDVLSAPAQLFVGTPIADWILKLDAFVKCGAAWLASAIGSISPAVSNILPKFPW